MVESAKSDKIIELYASGHTVAQVAAAVGCSAATVYRKLRDPVIRAAVSERRASELNPVVTELRNELLATVRYYAEVRDDADEATRDRLRAGDSIVDAFVKLDKAGDQAARVEVIEAALAELEKAGAGDESED